MSTYESRKSSPILHAGKTARDRASGAWARRKQNADARREWSKGGGGKSGTRGRPFPLESCNGRESRALKHVHRCNRKAAPGRKGGGPCQHRRGKKA